MLKKARRTVLNQHIDLSTDPSPGDFLLVMVRAHLGLETMKEQEATLSAALPPSILSTCISVIGQASISGRRGQPLVVASHILAPFMRVLGLLSGIPRPPRL